MIGRSTIGRPLPTCLPARSGRESDPSDLTVLIAAMPCSISPTLLASPDTHRAPPTRRAALGLALAAVCGGVPLGGARAEPQIVLPRMRSEFQSFSELPVVRPQHVPQDEGMLFFVQHSINANVIVYAAKRTPAGTLDPRDPIEVFWRRYATAGHRRELSFFERMFAFGIASLPAGEGRWAVSLVSFPEREGTLDTGPDGRPRLLVDIDRRPMRPVYVYAEAISEGFIPTIRHVDLFATVDGEKGFVRERVIFG